MCEEMLNIMSLGHRKLKQQWFPTTYPLEWLKFQILSTPNADKDVEQSELSFMSDGNTN